MFCRRKSPGSANARHRLRGAEGEMTLRNVDKFKDSLARIGHRMRTWIAPDMDPCSATVVPNNAKNVSTGPSRDIAAHLAPLNHSSVPAARRASSFQEPKVVKPSSSTQHEASCSVKDTATMHSSSLQVPSNPSTSLTARQASSLRPSENVGTSNSTQHGASGSVKDVEETNSSSLQVPSNPSTAPGVRQNLSCRELEFISSSSSTQQGGCLHARDTTKAPSFSSDPSNLRDVITAQEVALCEEYELARSPIPEQQEHPSQAQDDTETHSYSPQTPLNAPDAFAAQEASEPTKWPCSDQEEAASETAEQPTWESLLHKVPRHPLAAFAVQQRSPSNFTRKSWSISDLDDDGANDVETGKPMAHGAGKSDDKSTSNECLMERWLDEAKSFPFFVWSDFARDDRREVNVSTGQLLPAIQYPETIRKQTEGPCESSKDIAWRQMNMTSMLHITREIGSRKRLASRLKASVKEKPMRQEQAAAAVEEVERSGFPKAHCTIRPATNEDLDRIAEILELERNQEDCRQIFRADNFCVEDIQNIFRGCMTDKRPFLVATPNSMERELMDRSNWPKQSEKVYQKYLEFVRVNRTDEPQPVVGFAYLYDMNMGHGRCVETRHSAYMRVVVDPSYRKQLYGTALMDRMLLSSSPLHVSLIDHGWTCPSPARIYENPVTRNKRQFARLYIEVFCESGTVAELEWRASMLTKFNFKEVARLRQVLRLQRGNKKWLDMTIWEFEAQLRDSL